MGRAKQTRAQCYAKYDKFRDNYYEKEAHAEEMVALWQAADPSDEKSHALWHWRGVLKRYQNLILRWADRAEESCDWRE